MAEKQRQYAKIVSEMQGRGKFRVSIPVSKTPGDERWRYLLPRDNRTGPKIEYKNYLSDKKA